MLKKLLNNQKGGAVILITMLILSSILLVSLTASDLVINSLRLGKSQINSTKAYFAAEAGAERVLWEIRKNDIIYTGAISCFNGDTFCFDASVDGDITDCRASCLAGEFDFQLMSNSSRYSLEYEFVGGVTIVDSTGSYVDPRELSHSLNRVVEVSY